MEMRKSQIVVATPTQTYASYLRIGILNKSVYLL